MTVQELLSELDGRPLDSQVFITTPEQNDVPIMRVLYNDPREWVFIVAMGR